MQPHFLISEGLSEKISLPQYVEVALAAHVNQTFTYQLSSTMRGFAQPGARVLVPVGRRSAGEGTPAAAQLIATRDGLSPAGRNGSLVRQRLPADGLIINTRDFTARAALCTLGFAAAGHRVMARFQAPIVRDRRAASGMPRQA